MNIAFLAKEYPPYGLNFASALFYPKLAQALVAKGHRVHIVSQAVKGKEEYVSEDGVHVHRVGPHPKHGSALSRGAYLVSAWLKLRELIKQQHIHIVDAPVTFGEGFFPSLWKEVPLILQAFAFSDMFLQTRSYGSPLERLSLRISAYLEKVSLMRADRVVANSLQTYHYLTEQMGLPTQKVALVREARIDLDQFRFTPSDIRHRWGIPAWAPLVLYVGWLQARKGVHVLCEALPHVTSCFPEAVFVLLGRDTQTAPKSGSFRRYVESRAVATGVTHNMRIIGDFLSQEELVKLYSACDLLVSPSLSETFGWPVIEAMACGRPVVATATGIAPELEGASPVFLVVPPGDPKALAQGIIKVLSIPKEERERLAAGHRRIVEERFSFDRMVDEILNVYEEAIAEHTRQ
jgi:glycosyltransferase involved in cell wall biosynthesis